MVALDRFKVIAVINASGEINEEFLSSSDEGREWIKDGRKPSAIVLQDGGSRVMVHVTDLAHKTIESRLNSEYFPNI